MNDRHCKGCGILLQDENVLLPGYTTDLSGNKQYEPRLMTKEEEQIFWHMLDCSVPSSYMNVINNIICEEAALYFTDKKDADQVANSIQSRVQNYLNEEK